MYTRCPECGTVFRVNAAQLRAASGDVLCGGCAIAFNALKYLMDELPPAEDDSEGKAGDESLEFDAPERTWGSIFMGGETASTDKPDEPDSAAGPEPESTLTGGELGKDIPSLQAATGDMEDWKDLLAELPEEAEEKPVFIVADEDEPDDDQVLQAPDFEEASGWVDELSEGSESQDEDSPAPATDAMPEADSPAAPPWATDEISPPNPSPARSLASDRRLWMVAVVLLLTLIAQLIHANRDALGGDSRYGAGVRQMYDRIGLPVYPEWDLASYAIRGSEAIAGRAESNALQVIARVEIAGQKPVGLPLIRVVLQDRWSNAIASGVFYPRDYLAGTPEVPELVGPGTTIPVRINVVDPGAQAQGYVVDVCLPRRRTGLECQNAQNPFRQ